MSSLETTQTGQDQLLQLLGNEQVTNALQTTLQKLPEFLEHYSTIENMLDSLKDLSKYRDSISDIISVFSSQIPEITIGSETLESIATLVNKLPKITEYITVLEQFADIVQTVIADKKTMEFLLDGVKSLTKPVQMKIKEGMSIIEEAKQRAQQDDTYISIFSLLKLLKEPAVQEALHFTKAFLEVLAERNPIH